MDYESKYKELVEAVRAVVDGNPGLCKIDEGLGRLSKLLPEKESEDERIRKFLIDILSHGTWRKEWPFGPNEVVAYLEKQKTIQSKNEKEYVRILKSIIADFIRDKKPEDVSSYQQIYDWLDGRHIEQQPAEWSEEDEVIIREITSCLQENAKENVFYACTNWLKELPQRFVIQPKQEWSEGDEKQLNDIIDLLPGLTIRHAWLLDIRQRLKSLRPYPHWKPSEEQMKALKAINCHGGLSYVGQQEHLISLYNDIQKL
jgi:hypothetical protein